MAKKKEAPAALEPTAATSAAQEPAFISSYASAPGEMPTQPPTESEEIDSAVRGPLAAEADRTSRKPDVSWLEDALVTLPDGSTLPLFKPGDKLVIERYSSYLKGNPWLDTQTYVVLSIDDDTGDLRLLNPDLNQFASGNYITGPKRGDVYKLASAKANIGKRKRGRPRKNPIAEKPAVTVVGEKKRGRGRPPGSKNRPKEVIAREKELKRKEQQAKAAKRRKRRGVAVVRKA